MEYLVKIDYKARILELKQRYLKITVLKSNKSAAVLAIPAISPDISPEVPPSLDYVPASPGYIPESDPNEDPSEDDSSGDDASKTAGLEVQDVPTPPAALHIVPALPRRPIILVRTRHEIPFGRPYRIFPNEVRMLLTGGFSTL
nr:hypothetical protein [Tanacetum cinerariifolium]